LECATAIKQADADAEGKQMGLTAEELAFYGALTKPSPLRTSIKNPPEGMEDAIAPVIGQCEMVDG